MGEACGVHERNEKCIQNLVGKLEGNRPLGTYGRKWEDNIKIDFKS